MKIDVLTLFPEMIERAMDYSIPRRAQEKGLVEIKTHNLREFAVDQRGTVDDTPYGGGPGMILRVDVADHAFENIDPDHKAHRIMLTPDGIEFNQDKAKEYSKKDNLIFLCGRYEGFDARIDEFVDEKVSIGKYVLSGGELPALVIMDSVIRLITGVLGNEESLKSETFEENTTDYPQYTRPAEYEGLEVPDVLQNGDHQKIKQWRDSFRRKTD